MRKKTFILAFVLAMICAPLYGRDTTRVSYAPSGLADNWFIQAGGVANSILNRSVGPVTIGAELYAGKWFTPSLGVRVGGAGWRNRPNGVQTGWFSGENPFYYGHADVDVMWNVLNSFHYDEKRFWDLVPFIRGGTVFTKQMTEDPLHVEGGGGIGLHNGLRLGKRLDLYIEAAVIAAREKAYRERGNVGFFGSASVGLVVKVGPVGFRKNKAEKEYIYEPVYIRQKQTDTVRVETVVVDSVLIQKMREEPLTLFFDIDVTELNQRELDHLEFYAKWALTPDSRVLLTGSADRETGNPRHNQWLSEKRNEHVRDILIRVYGLKPENIREIANGDRLNEFRTPEQNRCVTISFIK